MSIRKEQIESIKDRINIRDIVGRYTDLKQVSGRWLSKCLFHDDNDPSMYVNENTQRFKCFGCHAEGDVIEFIMKIEGLDFIEAVKKLAGDVGIVLEEDSNFKSNLAGISRGEHVAIHSEAQNYFRMSFERPEGVEARTYLKERGITDEIAARFALGLSPDDWHGLHNHLKDKGVEEDKAVQAKVLHSNNRKVFDLFRNRLMFPIQDVSGNILGFGARIMGEDDPTKYLNSPESKAFKKGELVYGLPQARMAITSSGKVRLTEGYMDVISMHQFRLENTVGVLGTALTRHHVKKLSTFAQEFILLFDGDGAGMRAAFKASSLIIQEGHLCKVVLLPKGEDVDSLLQSRGRTALEECEASASEGLTFCLETLKASYSPKLIIQWVKEFMGSLFDDSLRAFYVPKIAEGLGLSEHELRMWEECKDLDTAEKAIEIPEVDQAVITPHELQAPVQSSNTDGLEKDKRLLLGFVLNPMYLKHFKNVVGSLLSTEWGCALYNKINAHGAEIDPYLEQSEREYVEGVRSKDVTSSDLHQWYVSVSQIAKGASA